MIFRVLFEFISNLIPVITMPAEILGAFAEAVSWVSAINYYIPVGTFILCVGVYFGFWLVCACISAILKLF